MSITTVESLESLTARTRLSGHPLLKRKKSHSIPPHIKPGLLLLLQAYEYALDVGRDRWEFAVELTDLRRVGLSRADCRWLLCKGWVEVARELSPRSGKRRFRPQSGLSISPRACLVISPDGVGLSKQELSLALRRGDGSDGLTASMANYLTPRWDGDRHQLRVAGKLVKQFKLPSPNQELVLAAFEEERWTSRIDDPLPPSESLDGKQRLHDTIKNLNRNQKHRLIRFMGDGTGLGVRWELIDPEKSNGAVDTSRPPDSCGHQP